MLKPFVFGVAVESEHFIGREKEIQKLSANFSYGVNTILMAPRRMGKTSLVRHVANNLSNDEIKVVHLDIFSCRSEYDFLNSFAAAILHQTSSQLDEWKQNAQEFLHRLTPRISISPEPMQDITISLGISPKTHRPEEILNLPELIAQRKGYHIVVCIDEFQQVGDFPDSLSVQKRMRSVWQHQKNVSYCIYGSKKNMMTSLFMQKSKPFYKFGMPINLMPIPTEDWLPYLKQRFATVGKTLHDDVAEAICKQVDLHSSYVQELAYSTLLSSATDVVTMEDVAEGFRNMLDENTTLFQEKTERLTTYQMNFLKAIVNGVHNEFGNADVREDYNLGSPSNITRIKTALLEKELVEILPEGIFISDPVLRRWLIERLFL